MEEPTSLEDNDIHQKNIPIIQITKLEKTSIQQQQTKQNLITKNDQESTETKETPLILLFQTTCMSGKRAYTIFWLAVHQLWVLSWMGHNPHRPVAVRLSDWLIAVQAAEKDMKQHTIKVPSNSSAKVSVSGDRLLCANDLFHIAGGMNRWMILTQRYIVTNDKDAAHPDLGYVINPSMAIAIHRFLDASPSTDFRFRPGVPIDTISEVSASDLKWKLLFSRFPVDLEQAHRRFVSRLSRVYRPPAHKKQKTKHSVNTIDL